ncbi:MAG: hypothetical protein MJY92_07880, partial [Bacteroidales bacterium]|nr:hypothetical protein [Bacteroidales bacterium]
SSNVAREVIIDYIASLGKQLYQLKNLDFPGLGRLRATRGGAVIFVPDEDLSIFPQYDCLEPVSLRFRPEPVIVLASDDLPAEDVPVEETPAEEVLADDVAAEETPTTVEVEETGAPAEEVESIAPAEETMAGQETSASAEDVAEESAEVEAVVPAESAAEEISEASSAEETAETAESPSADTADTADTDETPSNPAKTFWIGVLVLVILAALFFAAVAIIGRTYPDLIDPYLYTPSELKILRAKL